MLKHPILYNMTLSKVLCGGRLKNKNITLCTVFYKGLRSTKDEKREAFKEELPDYEELLGGFQRGLIVAKRFDDDEILDAYSTVAYFLIHDGKKGKIHYDRELKEWTPKEVKAKLRTGHPVSLEVHVDEHMNALLLGEQDIKGKNHKKINKEMMLEEYLYHYSDAFPRLKAAYST